MSSIQAALPNDRRRPRTKTTWGQRRGAQHRSIPPAIRSWSHRLARLWRRCRIISTRASVGVGRPPVGSLHSASLSWTTLISHLPFVWWLLFMGGLAFYTFPGRGLLLLRSVIDNFFCHRDARTHCQKRTSHSGISPKMCLTWGPYYMYRRTKRRTDAYSTTYLRYDTYLLFFNLRCHYLHTFIRLIHIGPIRDLP